MRRNNADKTTEYGAREKRSGGHRYASLRMFFLLVEVLKNNTSSEQDALAITEIRALIVDHLDKHIICRNVRDYDKGLVTDGAIEKNIRRLMDSIMHGEVPDQFNDIFWKGLGGHIVEVNDDNTRKYYFLRTQKEMVIASK